MRAQKEDEKVELLNLEKEKAALVELLASVRSQKEKEQVTGLMVKMREKKDPPKSIETLFTPELHFTQSPESPYLSKS